jgi:hypothetical protein
MAVNQQTINYATRQQVKAETAKQTAKERGRQQRLSASHREKRKQASQAQRAQLQVETAQKREEIRQQAAAQRASDRTAAKAASKPSSANRAVSATGSAIGSAGSTAANTSVGQLILLVLFVMAGLIIFYNLVTAPHTTNLRLNQLGGWLGVFSSNTPLFTKASPGLRPMGTVPGMPSPSGSTGSTGAAVG